MPSLDQDIRAALTGGTIDRAAGRPARRRGPLSAAHSALPRRQRARGRRHRHPGQHRRAGRGRAAPGGGHRRAQRHACGSRRRSPSSAARRCAPGDLDSLLHQASVLVAQGLEIERAKVLELLPGGDRCWSGPGSAGTRAWSARPRSAPTSSRRPAMRCVTGEPVVVRGSVARGRGSRSPSCCASTASRAPSTSSSVARGEPFGVLEVDSTQVRHFDAGRHQLHAELRQSGGLGDRPAAARGQARAGARGEAGAAPRAAAPGQEQPAGDQRAGWHRAAQDRRSRRRGARWRCWAAGWRR